MMRKTAVSLFMLLIVGCAADSETNDPVGSGSSSLSKCENSYVQDGEREIKSVEVVETKAGFSTRVMLNDGTSYESPAQARGPSSGELDDDAKVCIAVPEGVSRDGAASQGGFGRCWVNHMDLCDSRNQCGWSRRCFVGCVAWATAMCI
jgi:hypothetical protein